MRYGVLLLTVGLAKRARERRIEKDRIVAEFRSAARCVGDQTFDLAARDQRFVVWYDKRAHAHIARAALRAWNRTKPAQEVGGALLRGRIRRRRSRRSYARVPIQVFYFNPGVVGKRRTAAHLRQRAGLEHCVLFI